MRSSLGLHTANMWIPPIKSVDDFKNIKIVNLQQHIFTVLMDKLLNKKELEEARQKTNVANVSHHVGGDVKQGFTRFMTWLNKTGDQLGYLPSLQFYVQKILDDIRKLEVLESVEEGLKNKINFIIKGRKGAETTNKLRQNLTKEDNLEVDNDITVTNNITCKQLNYQSLNPPIAGAQNLAQTLELGNDAETKTIINLGGLSMQGDIALDNYDIASVNQINFFKGGGFGQNSLNTIKFTNVANVPFYLQNGDLDGIDNQTFKMKDDTNDYLIIQDQGVSQIKLNSQKLIRGISSTNPSNSSYGYIMDTLVRPPMYKQIFHNVNSSNPLSLTSGIPTFIFGVNIFPTGGDQVYNIGINYAEILFSYFQINFTASSPFVGTNNCQLFLSNAPNPPSYDPSLGNAIIFNVVNNSFNQLSSSIAFL
jgi:hypothetical protein